MTDAALSDLVGRLLTLRPGDSGVRNLQHAIESLLMEALRRGGRAAGETLVESLASSGHTLKRVDALPCMWRVVLAPPRVLEIWFTGGDDPVVAALSYRLGRPWGSAAQRRAAKLQAAFYTWYDRLDPTSSSLTPEERIIVLVGELEADVANGGFAQYLDNKGEARAREALECLESIGATRTARWLRSALRCGAGRQDLGKLDRQFNVRPEDLASLVMALISDRA